MKISSTGAERTKALREGVRSFRKSCPQRRQRKRIGKRIIQAGWEGFRWGVFCPTLTPNPLPSEQERGEVDRIAQLNIYIGEYEIAHDQEPVEGHAHFSIAYGITKNSDPLHGLAAYDVCVAAYYVHNYGATVQDFHHLLVGKPAPAGFDRRDAAMWWRHALGCYGYHLDHQHLGIPEPYQLDLQCGAAALAALLEGQHLAYDRKSTSTTFAAEDRMMAVWQRYERKLWH